MTKKALITGITGQDGAYLARLLLNKGYEVTGFKRRNASDSEWRLKRFKIFDDINMVEGDLLDPDSLKRTIERSYFDEIYNLAAQSHVGTSFEVPLYTHQVNSTAVLGMLEYSLDTNSKFYQAGTSEMFGNRFTSSLGGNYQDEYTPMHPRSPYGVSKLAAFHYVKNYREAYDLFAVNGILFNHESQLRGDDFVTQKIVKGIHEYLCHDGDVLKLGNLDAKRDWGHASDYVRAMWLMMQAEEPDDFVIATGETHTVRKFVEKVLELEYGIEIEWDGEGLTEVGLVEGCPMIEVSPKFFRPTEVDFLRGRPDKAKRVLGWKPKITFEGLIQDIAAGAEYADLPR